VPAFLSAVLTPEMGEKGLDLGQNGKKWRKIAAWGRGFAAKRQKKDHLERWSICMLA
jgi:hypothetical protein